MDHNHKFSLGQWTLELNHRSYDFVHQSKCMEGFLVYKVKSTIHDNHICGKISGKNLKEKWVENYGNFRLIDLYIALSPPSSRRKILSALSLLYRRHPLGTISKAFRKSTKHPHNCFFCDLAWSTKDHNVRRCG